MALGFTLREALRRPAILQVKWCPADVALILGDLEIDGHYYLAASEGQSEEYLREHGSCSELKCVAKMCEATYVTRHVCRCAGKKEQQLYSAKLNDVSWPEFLDEVVKAIDRDGTPIIHWDKGKREVTIQEYNAQRGLRPQYVAISHVWADGMGNPHENRLPNCQLSRIQDMVDELNFPKRDSSKRVGFWMDTLCVPVSNKFKAQKKASIRNMRQIYAQAAAVLVLDSRMQQVPHQDTSPAERYAQLYMSAWIRRLWTFQEGLVNRKLFLRWQDGAQDLKSLADDRLYIPFSVLGLDPKVYLDIENEEDPEDVVQRRMEMFVPQLGKFNTAIIFNSYPKLTRDGVRWAPRSLLGCQIATLGPALVESRSSHIRKVGPYSGLPVRYSAFVLCGVNQLIDQDKITVTFEVRGARKKSRHGHMHEVVDIRLLERNALPRDPDAMYTVLMADTLRGSSIECEGCIGIVQPLEHELGDVESIKVIRYECLVSLVKRWGKEPEGPLVLVGSSEAEWLVM